MGGDYYDRPVQQVQQPSSQSEQNQRPTHSDQSQQLFQAKGLHDDLNPLKWKNQPLVTNHKNPIVFALDVTGSMGEWTKIIYDKMPMFYGQLMMQGYVSDPAISFCAIGDHLADDVPFQVAPFAQGKQIDTLLPKLYLEGGGGGNYHESYELAAYFYLNNCQINNNQDAFFFVTGDERFFDVLHQSNIKNYLGLNEITVEQDSTNTWKALSKKFHVFHLHKPYENKDKDKGIQAQWSNAIGRDHVLVFENPKACVDIMLGAIALTSKKRTLEEYILDMQNREQGNERIQEVKKALKVILGQFDDEEQKVDEIVYQNQYKIKDAPEEFYCPITQELMTDPVMAMDGFTYERSTITAWFKKHDTSPLTGLQVDKLLLPNNAIKNLIENYNRNKNKE